MTMMKTKEKIKIIQEFLDDIFPNVGCELIYDKDYELVIAVMLSAQTSDIAVNKVTAILFSKYDSLKKLNEAPFEDVCSILHPIGLYKNKARHLKEIVKLLLEKYNENIPSDKKVLTSLPGVGNKTAGVIRAELFNIPELPVDTHVSRIAKRLKLADENDQPGAIETKLKKIIESSRQIKMHHQLIHFGRAICLARNPHCEKCSLQAFCKEKTNH